MSIQLYSTKDNSHTLYNSVLDETYHSRNGAITESLYVFLKQGYELAVTQKKQIRVLEIGFGTGLNAILTLQAAEKSQTNCSYYTLDIFPLPLTVINTLNYTQLLEPALQKHFINIHTCSWNTWHTITTNFSLYKADQSVHQFQTNHTFDVVYFDAFGPDKQPDMWTKHVFEMLYNKLKSQGIFVTYSAKGEVRRMLKEIGFDVELLPGPPMKRHMIRAIKL